MAKMVLRKLTEDIEAEVAQVAVIDGDASVEEIEDSIETIIDASIEGTDESLEEEVQLNEVTERGDRINSYAQEVKQWAKALDVDAIAFEAKKTNNQVVSDIVKLFSATASNIKKTSEVNDRLSNIFATAPNAELAKNKLYQKLKNLGGASALSSIGIGLNPNASFPSVLLTGLSGIGKSALAYEVADILGLKVHVFKPGALSKSNVCGLNYVIEEPELDADGKPIIDNFGKPKTKAINQPVTSNIWEVLDEDPCIILLDEMNRGQKTLDQSVQDALLGLVDDHVLPFGTADGSNETFRFFPKVVGVIATINPAGKVFPDTQEVGNALVNRFTLKKDVQPEVTPWATYCKESLNDINEFLMVSGAMTPDNNDPLVQIVSKNMGIIDIVDRLEQDAKRGTKDCFHFDTEQEIIDHRRSASPAEKTNVDLNPRNLSYDLGYLQTGDVQEFKEIIQNRSYFPDSKNRILNAIKNFGGKDKNTRSNSIFAKIKNVKPMGKVSQTQKDEIVKAAKTSVSDILNFDNPDLAGLFGGPATTNMNTTPQKSQGGNGGANNSSIFDSSDDDLD